MSIEQIRQGDLLFVAKEPPKSRGSRLVDPVLAYGEATGHCHRIISPPLSEMDSVVDEAGDIWMRCQTGPITIGHEEHATAVLPANKWFKLTRQREYDPIAEMRERAVCD